jgi:BMFP domain-containing protein YqiC
MLDLKSLDELTRRLSAALPPGISELREDTEKRFRGILQSGLQQLDLVTREEFDVQTAVLLRTREKLDSLEKRLEALGPADTADG